MNEKLQYAEMLEIPTSTCRISYKPPKKKLFKKKSASLEEPKMELVRKINEEENSPESEVSPSLDERSENESVVENESLSSMQEEVEEKAEPIKEENLDGEVISQSETVTIKREKPKKTFKINIVGVQLVVIALLVATILVTNALIPNSGINTLISSVFGIEKPVEIDNRNYLEFTARVPSQNKADITLENGVMSISKSGSIYTPCDGVVSSMVKGTDGKYTLEIEHSQKFKTVINGVDMVYTSVGEKVFSNVPVGYINTSGASMCFYGEDGAVITGYTIGDDALIWAE